VAEFTRVDRTAAATFAVVDARPTSQLDRNREVLLVWFTAASAPAEAAAETTAEDGTAPEQPQ
jgi:cell shape-determining protein MreC